MYSLVSDCTRMCQNGGILFEGNCTCDCAVSFSGDNCESECIVMRLGPANELVNYIVVIVPPSVLHLHYTLPKPPGYRAPEE